MSMEKKLAENNLWRANNHLGLPRSACSGPPSPSTIEPCQSHRHCRLHRPSRRRLCQRRRSAPPLRPMPSAGVFGVQAVAHVSGLCGHALVLWPVRGGQSLRLPEAGNRAVGSLSGGAAVSVGQRHAFSLWLHALARGAHVVSRHLGRGVQGQLAAGAGGRADDGRGLRRRSAGRRKRNGRQRGILCRISFRCQRQRPAGCDAGRAAARRRCS